MPSQHTTLEQELRNLDDNLVKVFLAIAKGVAYIADSLRVSSDAASRTGTTNSFGDQQLQVDVRADLFLYDCLQQCKAVETASSEEQTEEKFLGGDGFTVAFDPLDGSSVVGANWSVGSIFGIWAGDSAIGQRVRDMLGAVYSVYGPRTVMVVARPSLPEGLLVQEFTLAGTGKWICTLPRVKLQPSKKVFAPANLRAAAENAAYSDLVAHWIMERYTLRYCGGLCPDVHHIISKGGGVFCNPAAPSAPPKLRLLYEVAALACLVEAAGGASHDGYDSLLERTIESVDERTIVALGSKEEVAQCIPALQAYAPFIPSLQGTTAIS